MTVRRYDRGTIGTARKTDAGFLHVQASVTRVGVFHYQMPNGRTRREFRPAEEVLSATNLASIASSVITNEHPPGGEAVSPQNVRELSVGHADSAPAAKDGFINVGVTFTDADSIRQIERREKTEVSCGYRCQIDHTSGVWRGLKGDSEPEPYDVIQRGHVNNHIALTEKARGGSDVRLHLDSDGNQQDGQLEDEPMKINLTVDGQGIELDPAAVSVIKPAIEKRDKLIGDSVLALEAAKKTGAETQAKLDQAVKDLGELKTEVEKRTDSISPEALGKLVTARLGVMKGAAMLLQADALTKLDAVSDIEVMRTAVRANTELKLDADEKNADYRPDAYVAARFDALVENAGRDGNNKLAAGVSYAGLGGKGGDEDLDKRIAEAVARADGSWQPNKDAGAGRKEAN